MFRTGDWIHEACMDLVMHVTQVSYRGPRYTRLKVRWLVKRYDGSLLWQGLPDARVVIQASDYERWRRYQPPTRVTPSIG